MLAGLQKYRVRQTDNLLSCSSLGFLVFQLYPSSSEEHFDFIGLVVRRLSFVVCRSSQMKKRRGRRRNSDLLLQPSSCSANASASDATSASASSGTSAVGMHMDARAAVATARTGMTSGNTSRGAGNAGNSGVLNDFVEPMRGDQMSSPDNPDLSPGFNPDAGVHLAGGGMLDDKRFTLTSPLNLETVAANCFDPLPEAGLPLSDLNRGPSISVAKSEFV